MRVLIVEDEPLIAMDLEDIITQTAATECLWARTVADGLLHADADVDFALLDFDLGGRTSVEIAERLRDRHVPFCFVSGSLPYLPARFRMTPCIAKPFHPAQILAVLSLYGR